MHIIFLDFLHKSTKITCYRHLCLAVGGIAVRFGPGPASKEPIDLIYHGNGKSARNKEISNVIKRYISLLHRGQIVQKVYSMVKITRRNCALVVFLPGSQLRPYIPNHLNSCHVLNRLHSVEIHNYTSYE